MYRGLCDAFDGWSGVGLCIVLDIALLHPSILPT
jgi:hypothetical protein